MQIQNYFLLGKECYNFTEIHSHQMSQITINSKQTVDRQHHLHETID